MRRDGDVMLAALVCGETDVAAGLAGDFVPVATEKRCQLIDKSDKVRTIEV